MKNIVAGLLLASALGCHATTLIGATDADVDHSTCSATFPARGFYGPNILAQGNASFVASPSLGGPTTNYELVVQHDATAPVTVTLTLLAGTAWEIGGIAADWRFTLWDGGADAGGGAQTFEAPNVTGEFEESIYFVGTGRAKLDLFACAAATPTISKTVSWSPLDGGVSPTDASGVVLDGAVVVRDGGGFVLDGSPPGSLGDDAGRPVPLDGGIVTGPVGGE